jgi:TPR repeat protein
LDETEAVKWCRKAAEQGYAQAQNNLGRAYHNGQGVPRDEIEAVQWFSKAAEQGDADAKHNLEVIHTDGQRVAKTTNPTPMGSMWLLVSVVLQIIAVTNAKRKWRTLAILAAWMLAGLILGCAAGAWGKNGELGALIAVPLMIWFGIAGAIGCIQRESKLKRAAAQQSGA